MLHSICQQIWKTQQWPHDWKRSILIPIPKKGSTKECVNHQKITLISHASEVMLKILHARHQHYENQEFPDVQAGFRKGRGTRDQIAKICWIRLPSLGSHRVGHDWSDLAAAAAAEKARRFQKNIYLCFIIHAKAFDCVDHNELRNALKGIGILDPLTCLLRNMYAGQEATVRTLYGTIDWFKIEKGVWEDCLLSPCLFNLYAEHIMRNARLDELQAGIKTGGRNINNLRYADDTTLLAES